MADCAERFQTTFSQRYGDRCVGVVRKINIYNRTFVKKLSQNTGFILKYRHYRAVAKRTALF